MFLISKCRGDWDLGLCTTSVLAKRELQRHRKILCEKTCFDAGKIGFCHCDAVLFSLVPKLCTDLDLSLLYILILGRYSKFARENSFLALGVRFRSLARALAAGLPRQDHVYKTTDESFRFRIKNSMKCVTVVNWIPLRIRVCSRNTQPHLNWKRS